VFRVWNPCPLVATGNEQVHAVTSVALPEPVYQPQIVSGATNRLWPYSRLAAAVRTMNGASGGNMSNIVVFDTPEGGTITFDCIVVETIIPRYHCSTRNTLDYDQSTCNCYY